MHFYALHLSPSLNEKNKIFPLYYPRSRAFFPQRRLSIFTCAGECQEKERAQSSCMALN